MNGLLIPTFIGFLVYKYMRDYSYGFDYEEESIIVGEELEKAKNDSLALQGLSYESPIDIYNSTNRYLPISVMTYEEARQIKEMASMAGDISPNIYEQNYFNVLFMDKDYKVTGQLVDRKASIRDIFINRWGSSGYDYYDYDYRHEKEAVDTTLKHIAYSIAFLDSNNDGKLNSLDDYDLYISDLDGKNLTQVTNQMDIVDYKFIDSNSKIFVRFMERNEMKDEYKRVKFGLYSISRKTFDELKDIESKLNDIESELIR